MDAVATDKLDPNRSHSGAQLDYSAMRAKKTLSREDETALGYAIQTYGDLDARNLLVVKNKGLVHMVAANSRGTSRFPDIVSEGMIGLIRACETFDPSRGIKFSTYAVSWIFAKIQRYVHNLNRQDNPRINDGGTLYDVDEWAVREGRNGRRRRRAPLLSTDEMVYDGEHGYESGATYGDGIPSNDDTPDVAYDRELTRTMMREVVEEVLTKVAEGRSDSDPEITKRNAARARAVVERRLLTDHPETLDEIAKTFGLSGEAARLIEAKILRAIRLKLGEREFKSTQEKSLTKMFGQARSATRSG